MRFSLTHSFFHSLTPTHIFFSSSIYTHKHTCTHIIFIHMHACTHIIAHSQGLTNGLSDRDYRVLTINFGSIGKNGTSNFTNASEWAWHVESRAWYAEVTGYTATTVHVHFGPLLACSNFTNAGRVSTKYKATLSPSLLALS